jgi:hypothetical protein
LSVLVPDWWSCDLQVNEIGLTPHPTNIEDAIKKSGLETGT